MAGCRDPAATNHNASANFDDGSCVFVVPGCADSVATNFQVAATADDGSCSFDAPGVARVAGLRWDGPQLLAAGLAQLIAAQVDPDPALAGIAVTNSSVLVELRMDGLGVGNSSASAAAAAAALELPSDLVLSAAPVGGGAAGEVTWAVAATEEIGPTGGGWLANLSLAGWADASNASNASYTVAMIETEVRLVFSFAGRERLAEITAVLRPLEVEAALAAAAADAALEGAPEVPIDLRSFELLVGCADATAFNYDPV